jgi:hypothetical protein
MATKFIFGNKQVSVPGAYSKIESGIKNPTLDLAFGNALIIDAGSGEGWGGGSGINGAIEAGLDSVSTFDNIQDFQKFIGGGLWWYAAAPMFFPGGGATGGISSLTYIKAATTIVSAMTFAPVGGGSNGGTLVINPRTEGVAGNGVLGDETSATSLIEVTLAAADGDTFAIVVDSKTVADITIVGIQTIAQVVSLLVQDIKARGIVQVVQSTATEVEISAPVGLGAFTASPTINVTGDVTGTGAAYSGGIAGTKVTRGYSFVMRAGTLDTAKWALDFYRGSYNGSDGAFNTLVAGDIGGKAEADTDPTLLVSSVEFDSMIALEAWMNSNSTFQAFFNLASATPTGDGSVDATDATTYAGHTASVGGTDTYGSTDMDDALTSILDMQFDFIIAGDWGANAYSTNNVKIQAWINTTAKIKPDLYVGGGQDAGAWEQAGGSLATAASYNDDNVTLVHGGCKIVDSSQALGFRNYDSIIQAAYVLGREAGLEPQVPISFKGIGVGGQLHNLTAREVEQGLDAGVVMVKRVGSSYDIVKGVNTLQLNDNLVNPDGSTSSKQIRRIARQLNKELVTNATNQLLKNPQGTNRNTLSEEDLITWMQGYLKNKVASDTDDDLILSYGNITVITSGDAYEVTYEIVPNFEVNFIFMTGFLLDPSA